MVVVCKTANSVSVHVLRAGIALFPGNAQLLSCRHHYHDYIPPLVDPGKPQIGDCWFEEVTYFGPFTNESEVGQ